MGIALSYRNGVSAAIAIISLVVAMPVRATIDFVGNLNPPPAISTPLPQGNNSGLTISIEVSSPATGGGGQAAGIACNLRWGLPGNSTTDTPMSYTGDSGNRDRYEVVLPASGLVAGNYRFSAWCSDDGGQTQVFQSAADGILSITPIPAAPPGNVIVQLFEWKWTDIAQECSFLAAAGYTGVQVPSPGEHLSPAIVSGGPWWVRYQPLSYSLESRSGTRAEFASMVSACNTAGIEIYVDAVINHMAHAGFSITGTDGTFYSGNSYVFPGTWSPGDFHFCGTNPGQGNIHDINNYGDRFETQTCELGGLADLDTGSVAVQQRLALYLQDLIDLGVSGFRIDAAKHIDATELQAVFSGLSPPPYVYQEFIDNGGEQVRYWENLINGDVTDFGFSNLIGARFKCGASLASLSFLNGLIGDGQNFVVFTDNHDNQRSGGCVVNYRDGDTAYNLANVFMLAHPYGFPRVMSSYYFNDFNDGPPSTGAVTNDIWVGGAPVGCNEADWVCEHRRTAIANMVRFREVANGSGVTDWWDDGANRIAFGRGAAGFVAINNTDSDLTRTYQTSMADGTYCNVIGYDLNAGQCVLPGSANPAPPAAFIEVDATGQIVSQSLAARSAFAIHNAGLVSIPDLDGDGVSDGADNCTLLANPDQRDSNGDGYGNLCDPDINNDGVVNFVDLQFFRASFFATPADPNWNPDVDLNGDGVINFFDLSIVRNFFFGPPGPGVGPPDPVCEPPASALDPAAAFGAVMFFRGTAAGNWAAVSGLNNFVNVGDDVYVTELELAAGNYDYKVADADWTIERSNIDEVLVADMPLVIMDNGGGSPNGTVSVPGDGCWRFEMTTTDTALPVILMQAK